MPRARRSSCNAISAIRRRALSSERARESGDIFARSSANFLTIFGFLLFQLLDMLTVKRVCSRDVPLIPAVVAVPVATEQQDGRARRVERVQHTVRTPFMLDAQLTHVAATRTVDMARMRMTQIRTVFFKQPHRCRNGFLFCFAQNFPPATESARVFNVPVHKQYNLQGIFRQWNKLSECSARQHRDTEAHARENGTKAAVGQMANAEERRRYEEGRGEEREGNAKERRAALCGRSQGVKRALGVPLADF